VYKQFVLSVEDVLQEALKAQSSLLPWRNAVEQLFITSYKWWCTWACLTLPEYSVVNLGSCWGDSRECMKSCMYLTHTYKHRPFLKI